MKSEKLVFNDMSIIAKEKISKPAVERLAYTMRETALALGISYMSVFRLVKRGKLRTTGALHTKLITRSEILRFLNEETTV